jgi:hypothetical protein
VIPHPLTPRFVLPLAALVTTLAACDARTDDGYHGKPLFTLSGRIENRRTTLPDDVHLYLLWANTRDTHNVREELDIEATFPATFQMQVFRDPPVSLESDGPTTIDGQPNPYYRSPLTIGHFIAATSDADLDGTLSFPTHRTPPGILGVDPRHMIYYMPRGIPAGEYGSAILHAGSFTPGFHIVDLKCIGPARREEIKACLALYPEDVQTEKLDEIARVCGVFNPDLPWIEPSPANLDTELTVELMDDIPSWKPDPSECL